MQAIVNMRMDKCQVCEGVVNYIDKKLKDGDATTTIDTILEEVCRLFPSNAKDTVWEKSSDILCCKCIDILL